MPQVIFAEPEQQHYDSPRCPADETPFTCWYLQTRGRMEYRLYFVVMRQADRQRVTVKLSNYRDACTVRLLEPGLLR